MLDVVATIVVCAFIVFVGIGSSWLKYEKDKAKRKEKKK